MGWACGLAGLGFGLLGVAPELLGVGEPGFGEPQATALVLGGLLILAGSFLNRRMSPRLTFGAMWSASAVALLNTALAFVAINGIALLANRVAGHAAPSGAIQSPVQRLPVVRSFSWALERYSLSRPPVLRLPDESLHRVYPGWSRDEVALLLRETRNRGLRFDSYTQSRETEFHGRYVNVDAVGFRSDGRGSRWPMDPAAHNVWVFGGSTTFAYGLQDRETIPAQLEVVLGRHQPLVEVYNFGQGYFYSTQELALFAALLQQVEVAPAQVVFVDGINEHFAAPFYSDWIGDLLQSPIAGWFRRPAARSLTSGEAILTRWLRTKKLAEGVCSAYGIDCLFVWQPAPDWNYDLRYHLLWEVVTPGASGPMLGSSPHYAAMAALVATSPADLARGFLWLGDLQRDRREPLYVDRLHYTAMFANLVAESIAPAIEGRGPTGAGDPSSLQGQRLPPPAS
jgi:hypothetical protein